MEHTSPYRFYSLSRLSAFAASQEDMQMLTSLPMVLAHVKDEAIAKTLLDYLRTHKRFEKLERVCLARRLGLANQIEVVSSSNTSIPNSMPRFYSCFLSPKSSLYKMLPGTIRIFEDAKDVLQSYENEKRTPQRSIWRIARMGFQSGLVLPLHSQNKYL